MCISANLDCLPSHYGGKVLWGLRYTYALSFVLMREHAVHFFRMNDKNEEDGTLLFTIWLLLGLVGEQTHCVVLSP